MTRDVHQAVREVCLWLPEAEESISHGSSSFKVRRKTFAYFLVNHHGDGRVALWINAGTDAQEACVRADARRFFVPPYVGHRGWLGINLDQGLAWPRIADLVRAAYERSAPAALSRALGATPRVAPPARKLAGAQLDPLKSPRGRALLKILRGVCLALPEVSETLQFGHPVWQAGKKTFAMARCPDRRPAACFWVGIDRQLLLTADRRFSIPPYMGHNGWIDLDVADGCDSAELAALTLQSYRHFALQRMLKKLP